MPAPNSIVVLSANNPKAASSAVMFPFEIFVVAPLLAYSDMDFSPDVKIEPPVIPKTPWLYTPVTFVPFNSIVPVFVPFATSVPSLG